MTGAEALVEGIVSHGVDTVFGIPGSKFLDALDAMHSRRGEIRFITTRHEQGAAFMAMGYALARRAVGVCYATLGPGTTNLVTGVADAYKNAVPVVALGGMMSSGALGRDGWQEIDQAGVLRPVTKESLVSPAARNIPFLFRRAFRTASSDLPGPVYLGLPMDQLAEEIGAEGFPASSYRAVPASVPGVSAACLEEVLELLQGARAPVILAGRELKWDGLADEVLGVAEGLKIPVLTTLEGHGGVPTTHPLVLGPTGKSGWPVANECLRAADLVLALGVKFDFHGTGFEYGILPQGAKLVHVSRHPQFLGASFPSARALLVPVGHFLQGLGAEVTGGTPSPRDPSPWVEKLAAWRGKRDERVQELRAVSPLKPQWVAAALRPYAISGSFFTFDGGNFKKFLVRGLEWEAGGLLFKDDGYGCVGSALPTALGYQAGRPDCRVFCITGDMGYLVNGGELETAVREKLPVVTIIFNDGGLGNIREYQVRKYGGRHIGVDYAPVDYAAVARAFGAHGERVMEPGEVGPAIRRALESGKPAVLDMVVDRGELAPKG